MLTQLTSFAGIGLQCEKITVEVGWSSGEGRFFIVGLADAAVQESKQRVSHALRHIGYSFKTGRMVIVNLAPADVRKIGPRYDLPIALGLLIAHELVDIPREKLRTTAFLGELALDGSLRHVSGVLPAAIACRKFGIKTLVVPAVDGPEAALISGIDVIAPETMQELLQVLQDERDAEKVQPPAQETTGLRDAIDFSDVRGQEQAKRALEIAAAGGHNVLLSGAPGSGKTLLARAFRNILPPLTRDEAIEVTQIYSVANLLPDDVPLISERPFRVVHHTASGISIVGGGQIPGPGEISLAHRGILFLDELGEFPTFVLEVLRQPLEDRKITITRARGSVTFPADFTLIAAMNPPKYSQGSSSGQTGRKISAPLLDRIDLTVDVQAVPIEDLQKKPSSTTETSAMIAARVLQARKRQAERFKGMGIRTNKEMNVKQIDELCDLDATSEKVLLQAVSKMGLSARGYHRTIKVARTIADLAGCEKIETAHVAEALQYRQTIQE